MKEEKKEYGFDINRVKKSELNEFIESTITKRKNALKAQAEKIIVDGLGPLVEDHMQKVNALQIEALSDKLAGMLTSEARDVTNMWGSWSTMDTILRDLNSHTTHYRKKVHESIRYAAAKVVESPQSNFANRFNTWRMDAWETVVPLLPQVVEITKAIADLKTLEGELLDAVKLESTGKKAYMRLVSLGVDMKDFQPPTVDALPAIVKLSVPVCLLNGDCN